MAPTKNPGTRTRENARQKPDTQRGRKDQEKNATSRPNQGANSQADGVTTGFRSSPSTRAPVEDEMENVADEMDDETLDQRDDEQEDFERIEDDDDSYSQKRSTH